MAGPAEGDGAERVPGWLREPVLRRVTWLVPLLLTVWVGALVFSRGSGAGRWWAIAAVALLAAPTGVLVRRSRLRIRRAGPRSEAGRRVQLRGGVISGAYLVVMFLVGGVLAGPRLMSMVLWLMPMLMLVPLGIWLVFYGWPHRHGDTPYCAKCGYEYCALSDGPEERCPECAAKWNLPAGVVLGVNVAHPSAVIAGVLVLLLLLSGVPSRLADAAQPLAYRLATTDALLDSLGRYTRYYDPVWEELGRRDLSRAQFARLVERGIEGWPAALGGPPGAVNMLVSQWKRGRITESDVRSAAVGWGLIRVQIDPAARRGEQATIRIRSAQGLIWAARPGSSTFRVYTRIRTDPPVAVSWLTPGWPRGQGAAPAGSVLSSDGYESPYLVDTGEHPEIHVAVDCWLIPQAPGLPPEVSVNARGEPEWPVGVENPILLTFERTIETVPAE